jgi:hypothetical protein
MVKKNSIKLFGDDKIRAVWDEDQEKWYFSIVDVVAVLTDSKDFQTARKYWNKLKQRLKEEGFEPVTNCHQLKMLAADGKMRMTDVADTEQLLRIIQSVPSHKAEPFKQWLARVGAGTSCRPFQPSSSSKNRHPLPAWKIKRTNWNRSQQ